MTATQPNDRGADPAIAWLAIAPKIMWLVTSILALVTGLRWLDLSPAVMAAALAVPVIGVLLIVVVRRIPSGARRLAPRLVDLAAWLAGPRQASDAESWHADLLGDPEQDHPPEWPRQLRYALGFVGAAVRMRGRDWVSGSAGRSTGRSPQKAAYRRSWYWLRPCRRCCSGAQVGWPRFGTTSSRSVSSRRSHGELPPVGGGYGASSRLPGGSTRNATRTPERGGIPTSPGGTDELLSCPLWRTQPYRRASALPGRHRATAPRGPGAVTP
jgi:hypothetical protein